jgi:NOL1/NOP2/sun family putative RNA methylase
MEHEAKKPYKYNPKPEFEARMNSLLGDEADKKAYWEIVHKEPLDYIRCNTLKISPENLKKKFEAKGWKISQPYKSNPEIMIIESDLLPGELGRSKEHLLGYYYVQEVSSMLPILALKPSEHDSFLDLCASPGSKTTQAAAMMNNKGSILANDPNLGRMVILASNLEKCGVSNVAIVRRDGARLCQTLKKMDFKVNKILVDAPCSGEGTIRSSPKTLVFWNPKMMNFFAGTQKGLASAAVDLLQEDGEMVYSTCTHAPEENEEIIQYLIDNHNIEILPVNLPLKTRPGITEWNGKKFSKELEKCARIYPQDNNTEGFFLCKIRKISDEIEEEEE